MSTPNIDPRQRRKARLLDVLRRRSRGQTYRAIGQAIVPPCGPCRARQLYVQALYLWGKGWL